MKIHMILIWWKAFFVHCTQHDEIIKYKEDLSQIVFTCMELSKQSYVECMLMPYKRLQDYMNWKTKLEEEKQKNIKEEMGRHGKSLR